MSARGGNDFVLDEETVSPGRAGSSSRAMRSMARGSVRRA